MKKINYHTYVSLSHLYAFNKSTFDNELKYRCKFFLKQICSQGNKVSLVLRMKFNEFCEKVDQGYFNNLYAFLDTLYNSYFKSKAERKIFIELLEKYIMVSAEEKLVNLDVKTNEFDL